MNHFSNDAHHRIINPFFTSTIKAKCDFFSRRQERYVFVKTNVVALFARWQLNWPIERLSRLGIRLQRNIKIYSFLRHCILPINRENKTIYWRILWFVWLQTSLLLHLLRKLQNYRTTARGEHRLEISCQWIKKKKKTKKDNNKKLNVLIFYSTVAHTVKASVSQFFSLIKKSFTHTTKFILARNRLSFPFPLVIKLSLSHTTANSSFALFFRSTDEKLSRDFSNNVDKTCEKRELENYFSANTSFANERKSLKEIGKKKWFFHQDTSVKIILSFYNVTRRLQSSRSFEYGEFSFIFEADSLIYSLMEFASFFWIFS